MGKIGAWVLGGFLILWGLSMIITVQVPAWAFGVGACAAGVAILTGR